MTKSVVELMFDISTLPQGTGNVAALLFNDATVAENVPLTSAQSVTADPVASALGIAGALNNQPYNGYQVKASSVQQYLFVSLVANGVVDTAGLGAVGAPLVPTGTLVVNQTVLDPNYSGPALNPALLAASFKAGYSARQ
jgi:hypothetical protein